MIRRILSAVVTAAAGFFLLWFISPMFFGVSNIGTVLGALICCALIFRFGFSGTYRRLKRTMCRHMPAKILLRVVQTAAAVFVIYAAAVSGFMLYAMSVPPKANATAVVLGAQVTPSGRPCVLLQQRINAAQEYLEHNTAAQAVLTGSQGDNEPVSEAQAMYDSLTAEGIAPDRLYKEEQATNTEQNIRCSLKIIRDNRLAPDVAVVTDSYHQLRARIIAAKADPSVSVGAVNTKNNLIGLSAYPTYFVREWIAIPAEILK